MLWALLARVLRNRPPWLQAAMLGSCTGLFLAAGTRSVHPLAHIGSATILVPVVAATAGGAFYLAALRHDLRRRPAADTPSAWVAVAYLVVWLAVFSAAVWVLVAARGGVRVAVFAIVPLVLLASSAVVAVRAVVRSGAASVSPAGQARVPAAGPVT